MPQVRMPDGAVVAFPDDMPSEQIRGLIAQKFPQVAGGQPQQPTFDERFAASEQAPLPNAPEMEKGLMESAPIARGQFLPFSKNTKTGEVFFDTDAGIAKTIKDAFTLPGDVASGRTQLPSSDASVPGSISDEEPGSQEATARVLGLSLVATPTSAASRTGAAGAVPRSKVRIQEVDDLRSAANAAYKVADESGIVFKPQRYSAVVDDITSTLSKEGVDRTLHPGATAALARLEELKGQPVTLQSMETMRRIAQDAAGSNSPGERRLAQIMIGKIDEFVSGAGRDDVLVSGANPREALKALFDGRALWSKVKKAETIEELVERAANRAPQFSGSGLENAIRTEFRSLAQNKGRMRQFSKEEQAAIKRVARGGPVENIARMVGKFAPTGVVSSVLSGGAGAAVGGPVGAVALPAIGLGARNVATRTTKRNVDAVRDLVRTPDYVRSSGSLVNPNELLNVILQRGSLAGGSNQLLTGRGQ